MAVWNPSPATSAGLKIGDRILAVNQQDTHQMSLENLSSLIHGCPGTEVRLVTDSGGRRQEGNESRDAYQGKVPAGQLRDYV